MPKKFIDVTSVDFQVYDFDKYRLTKIENKILINFIIVLTQGLLCDYREHKK